MPVVLVDHLIHNRVRAIRKMHETAGLKRAELDLSGGIDSAVMLGLLTQAVGAGNITAVFQGINSNPDALARARECAETYSVALIEVDLTEIYETLIATMTRAVSTCTAAFNNWALADMMMTGMAERVRKDPTILGSIRSTLRAPVGRGFNRLLGGGIRHGTGNECEDRILRFYQKGGDGEVDSNPIAMLSKGEVTQLAMGLGVPASILNARPSPDLWGVGDQHNDEQEIGLYLGMPNCGHSFYSYIDLTSGTYKNVGLIERVSRFCDRLLDEAVVNVSVSDALDGLFDDAALTNVGDVLFGEIQSADAPEARRLSMVLNAAPQHPIFNGIQPHTVMDLLVGMRRVELATRHKMNPNCPTLGTREHLVEAGILSDSLPTVQA